MACSFFTPQDMTYATYGGPYGMFQPPPPPHPNMMNGGGLGVGGDPNVPYRGPLNVTDPRFAAKYGNPYLAPAPNSIGGGVEAGGVDPTIPMMGASPQMAQRYPYATLNNRGYSNGNHRYKL